MRHIQHAPRLALFVMLSSASIMIVFARQAAKEMAIRRYRRQFPHGVLRATPAPRWPRGLEGSMTPLERSAT
ncbi:MAG: hypothetical protein IH971_07765 [Candidatus Marinimicrobia bacterium]|nr:hypothetical protein [Candidatus Neomarinimicrobiota bacterium]